MKKLVLPKKKLGLLIFTFILTLSLSVNRVYAKDLCESLTNKQLINRYNVIINPNRNAKKATITISPDSNDTELNNKLKKVVFKITAINGDAPDKDLKVSGNKPLTFDADFKQDDNGGKILRVSLSSEGTPHKDPNCSGTIKFSLKYTTMGDPLYKTGERGTFEEESLESSSVVIDCDKKTYGDDQPFARELCKAKKKAKEQGNGYYFENKFGETTGYSDVKGEGKYAKFKCDYKNVHNPNDLVGDKYYVNNKYLYGSSTFTKTGAQYTYEYSPGTLTPGATPQCEVKCQEGVSVEYGPPIASKAGLCFEYKVKVTSRVSCNMSKAPEKPKITDRYCTPSPTCTDAAGSYYVTQGGPNQAFDSCIEACDGGKYTSKCSKKCYKQVYGKSSKSKKTSNMFNRLPAKKLTAEADQQCAALGGCYVRNGTRVSWTGGNNPGRWYPESGIYSMPGYAVVQGDGIYRQDYGGHFCDDICWWNDCDPSSTMYLNPGMSKIDNERNMGIYNSLVKECKAKASCTTKTATFSISVKYSYKNSSGTEKTQRIYFPYSTTNDKNSRDKLKSVENTKPGNKKKGTILSYDGCYENNENRDWYQAEWSFPGSWINNKTGEVSYISKNESDGWKTLKEKFCIPLNALPVNQKWWRYYYNKVFGKNPSYSINDATYVDKCNSKITVKTTIDDVSNSDIDWNITGKTEEFGYFGWYIRVDCFYALDNTPATAITEDKDECKNSPEPNYRIRPVDLDNLFPAPDGSKLSGTGEASKENTGRTPGYNWSKFAILDEKKNEKFLSDPTKYIAKVQKTGYSVYSNDYLDYEFDLTPDVLNKLRDTTKGGKFAYTDFGGESKVSSAGVVNYRSNVIRSIPNSKLPTAKGRLCNNMVNYRSNKCDDVSE